jgi:hypothetical protein
VVPGGRRRDVAAAAVEPSTPARGRVARAADVAAAGGAAGRAGAAARAEAAGRVQPARVDPPTAAPVVSPAVSPPAVAPSPATPIDRAVARYLAEVDRRVSVGEVVPEVAVSLRRNADRVAVVVRAAPADVAIDGWPALISAAAPGLKGVSPGSLEVVRGVARQLGVLGRAEG